MENIKESFAYVFVKCLIDSYYVATKINIRYKNIYIINKNSKMKIKLERNAKSYDLETIKNQITKEINAKSYDLETIKNQITKEINLKLYPIYDFLITDNCPNVDKLIIDKDGKLRFINKEPFVVEEIFEGKIIIFKTANIDIIPIETPAQLIEQIQNDNNKYLFSQSNKVPKAIFYRGNNINHDLSTSLYREQGIVETEHIINNRIIQSMPNDFSNCNSFFDKLTILKHFNCPSRLLDITTNALIASFFALDNPKSKENCNNFGIINYCFPIENQEIKNSQNSDSVALLGALATTNKKLKPYNFITQFLRELYILNNFINEKPIPIESKEYVEEIIIEVKYKLDQLLDIISIDTNKESFESLKKLLDNFDTIEKLNNLYYYNKKADFWVKNKIKITKIISDVIFNIENDLILKKYTFFKELQHQAQLINHESISIFDPNEKNINTFYIVQPSLNNNRIKNQQGLFIIIGAQKDNDNYFLKPNTTYLKLFEYEKKRRVIIINNSNKNFYRELNHTYGINRGFVYPELENKINQIKDDVMFEYGIKTDKE